MDNEWKINGNLCLGGQSMRREKIQLKGASNRPACSTQRIFNVIVKPAGSPSRYLAGFKCSQYQNFRKSKQDQQGGVELGGNLVDLVQVF